MRTKFTARPAGVMTLIRASHPGRKALIAVVNLLVASIVMSLPFIASAAANPVAQPSSFSASSTGATGLAPVDGEPQVSRAQTAARGGTITASRNPVTAVAESVRPIPKYTLSADDTLWTIANYYGLSAEAIAFANNITDPYHLQTGREILIPPFQGALYTVTAGDSIDSVASRFKVEPAVIRSYNQVDVDPAHFAPGQLIFVQDAVLPTLPLPPEQPAVQPTTVIARAAGPAPVVKTGAGYLAWPTAGTITQYMWAGHTGVDLAAPYGTGLAASVSGVITQNGWVAIGGLHICLQSGDLEECYYHMSAAYAAVGTPVSAGQVIGAIGLTGVTTGPHVHWETKINGRFVNPLTVQP